MHVYYRENLALNAEVFDRQPSVVGRHLIYQVITQRRPAAGQERQSDSLMVSSVPDIGDVMADPEHHPEAVLQLPTSILSRSDADQNKPLVLNTVALKDASLFPGILPVGTIVNSQVCWKRHIFLSAVSEMIVVPLDSVCDIE